MGRCLAACAIAIGPLATRADMPPEPPPPAADSTFDQLMLHVSRDGDTAARRAAKAAAKAELTRRGAPALCYLVEHAGSENPWFYIHAREMLPRVPTNAAADALLGLLSNPSNDVRKTAAFLLGFLATPQHAERVRPLLSDEHAAGAAVRTLGKWRDRGACADIVPHLRSEKEGRRVQAAVALGEIGDAAAAGPLVGALADPFFTVRNAAQKALLGLPRDAAAAALLDAWPSMTVTARRQAVRTLGELRWEPARARLREAAAADSAPGLRADAEAALRSLDATPPDGR